ncbi:MAG: DUF167 domain-containing protein [Candidatus Binatia bacterium]
MAYLPHVRRVIRLMPSKIWVTVKPQSGKSEVKKISDSEYAVSVKEPAREGKANEAVIELLADHFSVPKSSIRIVRGQTGRRKLIALP